MELLNLRKLQVLVNVAETGSATEAAKRLHLGQSAISQTLKEIQDDLGVTLFERRGRGLKASEAGERLAQEGAQVLAALHRVNKLARALQNHEHDEIRVGVLTPFIHGEIARCIAYFSTQYPALSLTLESHDKTQLLDMLQHGELDIAVALGGNNIAGLNTVATITMRVVCIVPVRHAFARKVVVNERDIKDERQIILNEGSPLREALEAAGIGGYYPEQGVIKASTQRAIVTMVESGAGIALVDPLVLLPFDQVAVLPFEPVVNVSLSLFAGEGWQQRPRVRELALQLYEALSPLSSDSVLYA